MKGLNKFYFPGKEPDERVVMVLRRHKVVLGKKIATFVLGGLSVIVVYVLLITYTTWLDDASSFFFLFFVLLTSLVYLYLLLFLYHAWVDYYLDIWIVTNERIIATEQKGLFNRVVSELRLNRIQDVSCEVQGFLPTIFKYGTINVQTASEEDKFIFNDVPRPEEVSRQILELHERYVGLDQNQPSVNVNH